MLLKSGAQAHLCNYEGDSPLLVAIRSRDEYLVHVLLFLAGPSINTACLMDSLTPLHLASALGADRIVAMLLNAGAFLNAVDDYGLRVFFFLLFLNLLLFIF